MKVAFVWSVAFAAILVGCRTGTQHAATTLSAQPGTRGRDQPEITAQRGKNRYTLVGIHAGMPLDEDQRHIIRTINYDPASMTDEITRAVPSPWWCGSPLTGQPHRSFVSGAQRGSAATEQAAALRRRPSTQRGSAARVVKAAIKNNRGATGRRGDVYRPETPDRNCLFQRRLLVGVSNRARRPCSAKTRRDDLLRSRLRRVRFRCAFSNAGGSPGLM